MELDIPWITAAGQREKTFGQQLTRIVPKSPMNLGDLRNVIVVTSCEICSGPDMKLWPNGNWSYVWDGLVNLAAPGGSAEKPIPSAADGFEYATAYGTSQATAFVGGLAAAMMSCWPDKYQQAKWLKLRLQVTAQPMTLPEDAKRVTGGVVNIERALLDPEIDWVDTGDGFNRLIDAHWCKKSLHLKADNGEDLERDGGSVGAIVRFQAESGGQARWQIASIEHQLKNVDRSGPQVRWSGPGAWADNDPILAGKVGAGPWVDNGPIASQETKLKGEDILSFIPAGRIRVSPCS